MYKAKLFRTIALAAFLTVSLAGFAQSVIVSGTVTDAGEPMIGATVMVRGTQNAAITDIDGKYTIDAKAGDVLVFSFIGYLDEERTVSSNTTINVEMKADVSTLEQVVVLGYGVATKKKDLSASVGIVASPEQIAKTPVTSAQSMLQGQIPGVTVTNDGGSPGSTPNVVIRGQGSKNGDSVLWVVDGVPGAPINSVSDIESMVVLKDAASAAIYGAQSGAGGVILVTTKKGTKGVSLSYDGLVGVRDIPNMISSLTAEQQIEVNKLAYANAGLPCPEGWDVTKNPWIAEERTDWIKEVYNKGFYHRHNVVLNAGGEKFKNRIGLSYENNEGVVRTTFNKNLGVNWRGEWQVCEWVKLTEDLRWGTSDGRDGNALEAAMYYPHSASMTQASYDPVTNTYSYAESGYGGSAIEDPAYIAKYGDYSGIHGLVSNPVHSLEANTITNQNSNFYSTTGLELANIVKGLKFNSRFTYITNSYQNKVFSPRKLEVGSPTYQNSLTWSSGKTNQWKTENTLTYDRTFGKHTVGALVSTTADHYSGSGFSASESDFESEEEYLQFFQFGKYPTVSDYYSGDDSNLAIIARLSYSYNDRYFVTASWRRDYAGRLPSGSNYGDFPAVTGAWKISSEPFFTKNSAVTLLKLRASWGRIGNLGSIPMNYKANNLSSSVLNYHTYYDMTNSSATYGTIFWNSKALNPNLTWETSEQFDVGIDAGFLDDRLSLSIDGYYKRTYNLIQEQTMDWPSTIGADAKKVNLGQISNRGIEVSLGWQDKVGDWTYWVNGNAAYNKNRVDDIGVKNADGSAGMWTDQLQSRNIYFYNYSREGGELREYYLIKCLGIFQSWEDIYQYTKDGKLIQPNAQPGDLKFEDYNDDGQINVDDRQFLGNATPDITYNFNLGFTWKDLTVSAQIYGVQGAQSVRRSKQAELSMSVASSNRNAEILNAWSETNRSSNIPRISAMDYNNNFWNGSSWYLEDSSFCRLKNVTITYDFTRLLRKVKYFGDRGSAIQLYFSGENLFTLTRYSGIDPECGEYDFLKYPVSRIISGGVKLTF